MTFDWSTLVLQAINFLVLVWLLQRFLYRPVLAAIDRRRATIAHDLDAAAAAQRAADGVRAELERRQAEIGLAREQAIAAARQEAETERRRRLAEIEQETSAMREEAHSLLEKERQQAVGALRREAASLGVGLAERLLRVAGERCATGEFLDHAIAALAQVAKESTAGTPDAPSVRVTTAVVLDDAARRRCIERIARALGGAREVEFAVEPALIAGVEIHLGYTVVRQSWRGALDAALTGLVAEARVEAGKAGLHAAG